MRVKDKVALITGAASGIGAATARRFVMEGASLFAVDVNEDGLGALSRELGDDVVIHVADMSKRGEVEAMLTACIARFGRLDVLVNNAGIGCLAKVAELDPDDWRHVMAVDVDATFFACRTAMPHLIETRGSIINTASISGMAADYAFTAYATAKAAVIALTRSIAVDYAAQGVRANCVSPGLTLTPIVESMPPALVDMYAKLVPMRRAARPDEIAAAILFLASEDASYITGQNIAVDGGLIVTTGAPDMLSFHSMLASQSQSLD